MSDLQYGETATGAPAVQGQYIGADQTHARSGAAGRKPGYGPGGGDGMNSKQLTELNARREMSQLVLNLRLKSVELAPSYIDPAVGLFKLALNHNFVQGRSISTVAAVALYLQCRRSKETNEVMLIDIAECMNVNVFVLGKMYTKMIQMLYGTTSHATAFRDKIDTINPENLIRRFAKGLDFPGLQVRNQVVNDAIRLVQRMDRDWMATGRRPAGICGAALILAARMNNFRRTVREVVLVVKVTEITINKRLEEFSYTDSSNLTIEEFRGITLERDCDPPSYYKARQEKTEKKGKKRKGAPETAAEIEEDEDEGRDPTAPPAPKRPRIDSDGFAIPDIPIDPTLRKSVPRNPVPAESTEEQLPELSTLVASSAGEREIDEALTLAVNSAISEMETEQQALPMPRPSGTPEAIDSAQRESETSSSEPNPGDQPKRRQGRPKGAKNWQPPPATTAELALEAAIEGEVREVLESGVMQAPIASMRSTEPVSSSARLTSESNQGAPIHANKPAPSSPSESLSEQETPIPSSPVTPSSATPQIGLTATEPSRPSATKPQVPFTNEDIVSNPPIVEDTTLIYLDDDPEVSTCMLSQEERDIKERIWVAENADWLRKDHVKKIKAELQAAADREAGIDPDDPSQGKGKGRGRKKKRGRLGDVSYLDKGDKRQDGQGGAEDGEEGGTARSAREATLKMMAHRGYSRRVNYDVFKSLFPEEEEATRQRSSRSSTSTTAAEKGPEAAAKATGSESGSPVSTSAPDRDGAAGAEESTTTVPRASPNTVALPLVISATESAAPPQAKPKPKPRAQTRKAVSAVAVPIAEPGKPPPAPSGPSRPTKPPTSSFVSSSAATKGHGRAPGGQKGFEEREARRQSRAAANAIMAKEWDAEVEEEEELLTEAEREERSWMARAAPKDGPALAIASAGVGRTQGTAVRLATPASRAQSPTRQQPPPTITQSEVPDQGPPQITTPDPIPKTITIGEEEITGSIDTSPLTSLRSSVIGDEDEDEDGEGDADDYVEADDDEDVEAAFAGRFARRSESFDDDDDEDMEDG